jgi:hypothetical protein
VPKADALLERIATFQHAGRGEVVVRKVARGYSPFSARNGAPIARLRPIAGADTVQVRWWSGERWGASGALGVATMRLDDALDYIAAEPAFRIHT